MIFGTKNLQVRRKPDCGFTLLELLLVIGILVVLAGILLPALNTAYRSALVTRQQADFQAIAAGLEAYKSDFGSYPTVDAPNAGAAILAKTMFGMGDAAHYYTGNPEDPSSAPTTYSLSLTNTNLPLAYSPTTVYRPGDIVLQGAAPIFTAYSQGAVASYYVSIRDNNVGNIPTASPSIAWALLNPFDGHDGPGFRVRFTATSPPPSPVPPSPNIAGGAVSGPYLRPENFHLNGMAVLDRYDDPILYAPIFTKAATTAALGLLDTGAAPTVAARPFVNYQDNLGVFYQSATDTRANAIARMAIYLGDYNVNGQVDTAAPNNEPVVPSLNFILWSAGPDKVFGPSGTSPGSGSVHDFDSTVNTTNVDQNRRASTNCDDISNYR